MNLEEFTRAQYRKKYNLNEDEFKDFAEYWEKRVKDFVDGVNNTMYERHGAVDIDDIINDG